MRRQLFREDETSRLAWIGGVFGSATLLSRFRALAELKGSVTTAPPEHIPAVGVLMLA